MGETSKPKKVEELKEILEGKKKRAEQASAQTPPQIAPTDTLKAAEEKIKNLEEELARAKEETQANYDKFLRAVADLENYKKRSAKDQEDMVRYGQERTFEELLLPLDDFDRILEHLPTEKTDATKNLVDGIHLVQKHLLKILKKHGLHEVETKHKMFDPHQHEAISQIESNDHKEGEIVQCHRKGYMLHDRLLRPAAVTIAKKAEEK